MKISNWNLYQYCLSFRSLIERREGLILALHFENGKTGWGEIAPYPGRSSETLEQAKDQLLSLLKGASIPQVYPSVQIGWESAHKTPVSSTLSLRALLTGSPTQMMTKAKAALDKGHRTVKVKISQLTIADAHQLLKELLPQFNVGVDLNRAFSFNEARTFFSVYDKDAFAFIEEPTYEIDKLSLFSHPLSIDESLLEIPLSTLLSFPNLKTIDIKPTMIGGLLRCQEIQHKAQEKGIGLVLSSGCESGLGLAQIARLAHDLELHSIPLGLDTLDLIQEDLVEDALDFGAPYFSLPLSCRVKKDLLQEIAHG